MKKITPKQVYILIFLLVIIAVTILYFSKSPSPEHITISEIDYASLLFKDSEHLGLVPISPEVGLQTGLEKYPQLTWKIETVKEESDRISIDIEYPQFNGGEIVQNLNQYVSNTINNIIENDRKELKELILADPESFLSRISLGSEYRMIGVNKGIVSFELVVTDFTGGGNGNHDNPYTINWDLKSDKLLNQDQIFCSKDYISVIAPIARKQLLDRIPEDFDSAIFLPEERDTYNSVVKWIEDGTEPESDNFDNLLLYNGGLIVVFDPYQVHSGASGIVRTFIPKSAIPGLICLPS